MKIIHYTILHCQFVKLMPVVAFQGFQDILSADSAAHLYMII